MVTTMKSFNEYLTGVDKQYSYRIKIANELPNNFTQLLKKVLVDFDIDSVSDVKSTPIMPEPLDFTGIKNEPVNIIDVILNYPASIDQLRNIISKNAECCIDINKIMIVDQGYAESLKDELSNRQDDVNPKLGAKYPEQSSEQKELGDAYNNSFMDFIKSIKSDVGKIKVEN